MRFLKMFYWIRRIDKPIGVPGGGGGPTWELNGGGGDWELNGGAAAWELNT